MADITATKECFFALVRRKILELNLEKYDKQKPKNLF
jgi:hypothetical protein